MANDVKDMQKLSPAEVAKQLKTPAATPPDTAHATILSKPDDTTKAKEETAARDAEVQAQQAAELAKAADENDIKRQAFRERVNKSGHERAVDSVAVQLEIYKNSEVGSAQKVEAMQKILTTVKRYPKNNVLNTILDFFIQYKDEEWLGPLQALQGTAILDKSTNIRVRAFYEIMMELAKGTASKKTIALDMIRNLFESDDLVNWISVKMSQIGR